LCFGYPTQQQRERELTPRFDRTFIVSENRYRRLDPVRLEEMHHDRQAQVFGNRKNIEGAINFGQYLYRRKFSADFSVEMSRSVRAILRAWKEG
jgi:hypothetical protein